MTLAAFLSHLGFVFVLTAVSAAITRLMLERVRIMDAPNPRSSHQRPTPRAGGISIVATFLIGVGAMYFLADRVLIGAGHFAGFAASSLVVAGVSFYDDLRNKSFAVKIAMQIVAVAIVLAFGLVVDGLALPVAGPVEFGWLAYPLTFFWILGLTNAFNFMDGLDGLAAGTAVIAGTFFAAIAFSQGSTFVYLACLAIVAGTLGFLVYNFPPARIFMGDVGSAFLGFSFAVLAIIAARYDHSHTSFLVMPLLLFNFIYDTAFTFVRRLMRGERVTQAHRSHLYQLFNQLGFSHRAVTLFHCVVCVAQGLGAVWMVNIPGEARLLVFLPFLAFQIGYTIVIVKAARKAGLV